MLKKNLITCLPLAGLFILASCARNIELPGPVTPVPIPLQAHYQNMIVFGDSLSDAASLQKKDGEIGNNIVSNSDGVTHAPITSSLDPNGKWRPLWDNMILDQLTLDSSAVIFPAREITNPQLELPPSPLDDNISFAVADALSGDNFIVSNAPRQIGQDLTDNDCLTIGIQGDSDQFCVPGMLKQVDIYLNLVSFEPSPNTLFVLWAGSNDILNGLVSLDILNDLLGTPGFITDAVSNIKTAVEQLIMAGATKENIMVIDLPDLAATPDGKSLANSISGGNPVLRRIVLRKLSSLSSTFNSELTMALATEQMAEVNIFQASTVVNSIIANPKAFDITNTTDSCVADGQDPQCLQGDGFYLFFNGIHPSAQAHSILANSVARALASLNSDNWESHVFMN